MTAIIAVDCGSCVLVLADCRVSYGEASRAPVDNLQKLYQVGANVVFGFSGHLHSAARVIDYVREQRAIQQTLPDSRVRGRHVMRWIRRLHRRLSPDQRRGLQFLVAEVDLGCRRGPGRSFPGLRVRVFPASPASGFVRGIGVSREHVAALRVMLQPTIVELRSEPRSANAIRALQRVQGYLADRLPGTVGGLFQCAVLDAGGVAWANYSTASFRMDTSSGRFVQINNLTGEQRPLLATWEWLAKPSP